MWLLSRPRGAPQPEGETVARRWPHAMLAFHGNQRRLIGHGRNKSAFQHLTDSACNRNEGPAVQFTVWKNGAGKLIELWQELVHQQAITYKLILDKTG
jgi:hypothetical protein